MGKDKFILQGDVRPVTAAVMGAAGKLHQKRFFVLPRLVLIYIIRKVGLGGLFQSAVRIT